MSNDTKVHVEVIVGGQYGSEAKGHVTGRLTRQRRAMGENVAVMRVAGPNAGHTAHTPLGEAVAFRQIPVGVIVADSVRGLIAAGSEIDPDVLISEIETVHRLHREGHLQFVPQIIIDPEATILLPKDKDAETDAGITGRIGSTGKGIGAARVARLDREPGRRLADNAGLIKVLQGYEGVSVDYTVDWVVRHRPETLLVEGTQGFALGLRAGHYPQCTSSDCRAIDFLSMAGISPWAPWVKEVGVTVVARVYPIRVAGNSGPLRNETTWEDLGLPEERTTVTQKIRRVGGEDWDLVAAAVDANGGGPGDTEGRSGNVTIALTMLDQKFPEIANLDNLDFWNVVKDRADIIEYQDEIQKRTGAYITMITTGPNSGIEGPKW